MDAICDDLAAEHAALDAVVADLDEAAWNGPTPAAGWTVKDTIVHLVQADLAARLAATEPEEFVEVRSRIQAGSFGRVLGDGAGRTGADVLAWWRAERAIMLDAFRARVPKDRIPWFGPDMSARSFATARLMETWAHGTDVAETVGAELPSTHRLRHVAHIGVSTRAWSYVNRGLVPPADPVRVELTAPSGELWTWGPDDSPDRITGPALDFCLLVTQRCHREDTGLVAEGAAADEWLSLAQAFAGPATSPQADRRRGA